MTASRTVIGAADWDGVPDMLGRLLGGLAVSTVSKRESFSDTVFSAKSHYDSA
jgi:hypothetical protein